MVYSPRAAMYPEIFHIPFLHSYGAALALAFLAGGWVMRRLARRAGLDVERLTNLAVLCVLVAIAGAKLMIFVVDAPYYLAHPGRFFSMSTMRAAGVYYGGLVAAVAFAWWYARRHALPFGATSDAFAPAIALGHGITRFGCLAAGCCWGTRCDLPWAITFTNPEAHRTMGTPLNVPLHPAQLYQSAAEFAIFAILWRSSMRPHVKGSILAQFLMLEGIARFVVELFREHQQGNLWLGLDTSQCLSIALILTGIAAFRWDRALARPKRP